MHCCEVECELTCFELRKLFRGYGVQKKETDLTDPEIVDATFSERRISKRDRFDQNITPINPYKFNSHYSKLKFPDFLRKRNPHAERQLQIPTELQKFTKEWIAHWGWSFLDRELVAVNVSWVREFYANYYTGALDAVHLRSKRIPITEEVIEWTFHFLPRSGGKDAFEDAESERKMMTFDWDKVLAVIAKPGSSWIYEANKITPRAISQATEAEVVWLTTDKRPTIAGINKVIPYGDWFGSQPLSRPRGRQQAASHSEAGPSASAAPLAPSTSAPATSSPQPFYRLIHRLVEDIARLERRLMRKIQSSLEKPGARKENAESTLPGCECPPGIWRQQGAQDQKCASLLGCSTPILEVERQ
ncbi:hypothetical protein AHAS_Ahas19G0220800 [Arachis hypogaea]